MGRPIKLVQEWHLSQHPRYKLPDLHRRWTLPREIERELRGDDLIPTKLMVYCLRSQHHGIATITPNRKKSLLLHLALDGQRCQRHPCLPRRNLSSVTGH
jgi:hypothetical protein